MALDIIAVAFLCVAIVLPSAILLTVVFIGGVLKYDLVNKSHENLEYNYQLVRFQINRAQVTLQSLTTDPDVLAVLSGDVPAVQVQEKFDTTIQLVDFFENVVLQKNNCQVIAGDSDYQDVHLVNFFQSDYCRGYGHQEGAYVSSMFNSYKTRRPVMVMTLPIRDAEGAEIGIVSGVLDIGELSVYLANLQQVGQYTLLLDRNNQLIIDTRSEEQRLIEQVTTNAIIVGVMKQTAQDETYQGVFESTESNGDAIVSYNKYTHYPGQFTLINIQPRANAYHLQNKIILILSLSGIGMILTLILALWVTVRLSTRRLNQMTTTIRDIAAGKEHERLPEKMFASEDEVGVLGRSFNQMIDRIHETQSQLQSAKAKSDAILLGIGDGVVAIDTNGIILRFNRAAEQISGLMAVDIIGKPYLEVLHFVRGAERVPEDGFIRRALGGSLAIMPDDVCLIHKDGTFVSVADASGPVLTPDGEVIGAVIVFRDVTHEREVDRMKSEFVSVTSHQLRTPLTAIRWYLEDLQSLELGPLTDGQKDNVNQAVQSIGRMIRLVNDLLNVSRLESGRLAVRPQSTDIAELIEDVVKEDKNLALGQHCDLTVKLPAPPLPAINIDPVLVRQVLINLVSNAIKYSESSSKQSTVEVTLTKDGSKYYRVTVKDSGMGIAVKDQDHIFQRFFRADNALKMQTEGSGLGLYIAKLIIEASGGMISFDTQEGQGTTFWFLLPIAGSPEREDGKRLES